MNFSEAVLAFVSSLSAASFGELPRSFFGVEVESVCMLSTTRVTRRLFCEEGLRLRLRLERSNEKRRACSTWVARKQKGRHVKGMRPVSAVDKDISQS